MVVFTIRKFKENDKRELLKTTRNLRTEEKEKSNKFWSLRRIYDSVVTRALGLVTLTPSALALARIVTRFLEETAVAILVEVVRSVIAFASG
jgi:hypothetical protein